MANRQHLSTLKQGITIWNEWRKQNPDIKPDLHEANLAGMRLCNANLSSSNLSEADLSKTDLREANLAGTTLWGAAMCEALLCKADLGFADLTYADLSSSDLTAARLWKADLTAARLLHATLVTANLSTAILRETNLSATNLNGADLSYALLVETNLRQANLSGCSIHGVSAWDIQLEGATQTDMIITLPNEPTITVDTFELAQFLSLLLNHKNIHQVITSIKSNIVLILGRLTPQHKAALEAIKNTLRQQHYSPVLFDFEKPLSRDFSETVHFGGQKFIPEMLPKIARMRQMISERNLSCDLEVDGGVHEGTATLAVKAGANLLVAGSAVYNDHETVAQAMEKLRKAISLL